MVNWAIKKPVKMFIVIFFGLTLINIHCENNSKFGYFFKLRDKKSILKHLELLKNDIKFWTTFSQTKNISDQIMWALAKHPSWKIRIVIAMNAQTPQKLLKYLVKDRSPHVKIAVIRNSKTDLATILEVIHDLDPNVRYAAAKNEKIPVKLLYVLSKSQDEAIRYGVALNNNSTPRILLRLAKDKSIKVRSAVAANAKSINIFKKLVFDNDWHVRYGLALNINISEDIQKILLNDPDRRVIHALRINSNISPSIRSKLPEKMNSADDNLFDE